MIRTCFSGTPSALRPLRTVMAAGSPIKDLHQAAGLVEEKAALPHMAIGSHMDGCLVVCFLHVELDRLGLAVIDAVRKAGNRLVQREAEILAGFWKTGVGLAERAGGQRMHPEHKPGNGA